MPTGPPDRWPRPAVGSPGTVRRNRRENNRPDGVTRSRRMTDPWTYRAKMSLSNVVVTVEASPSRGRPNRSSMEASDE